MVTPKIVSLIASGTEIVCALGFGEALIGRSHECDYPDFVHSLPQCTETRFPTDVASGEIDRHVKAILEKSLSVYWVRADMLTALNPDLIITQIQCKVCAVSRDDVVSATCEWLGRAPAIVSLETNYIAELWRDIQYVADAIGAPTAGHLLVSRLQGAMTAIARTSAAVKEKPTVAYLEWIDPLMAGGNWMPELIEMAGGVDLFGTAGAHSAGMKWEAVMAQDPDVIVVAPCGFDIPRTLRELSVLTATPEWERLKAVSTGRVYIADGNQYFNRPGPRLLESLQILAEIFHPEQFKFGHAGNGWIRFQKGIT